ncbi:MAG: flavodoxin-dependent (E)-4-hydroxy-3-methylbut-2-enyl-diphosphate synthase [Candidatus Omnitrophica bacterium]|nr:flavodoxin-dependent (E)-4-hydroxy-3-methylbut-2-enyl-diphosphate synthase [Candidatus Omnitrophota bacterium]
MNRFKTKTVKIGKLKVGGANPIRIKAMLKTPTRDVRNLVKELRQLDTEGAEAVRLAVRVAEDAKLISTLRKQTKLPFVADIHFDYRLALAAIDQGFDAIRLNPLNISKPKEVKEVIRAAKANRISIRVGVNSGGFKRKFATPTKLAQAMVKSCENYLKLFEAEAFFDLMFSLKGSSVTSTVQANKLFAKKYNYPLHLGVTATGPFLEGTVKSSVGLGALLNEGIGDIIRVSLTAPSFWEVRIAKQILQALNLRRFGPEIISCPTCSRCEVNLIDIVDKFKKRLEKAKVEEPLEIALMGCVVNGPGEARQADIGAAFGKNKAVIFKGDKILKRTSQGKVIDDLLRGVTGHGSR